MPFEMAGNVVVVMNFALSAVLFGRKSSHLQFCAHPKQLANTQHTVQQHPESTNISVTSLVMRTQPPTAQVATFEHVRGQPLSSPLAQQCTLTRFGCCHQTKSGIDAVIILLQLLEVAGIVVGILFMPWSLLLTSLSSFAMLLWRLDSITQWPTALRLRTVRVVHHCTARRVHVLATLLRWWNAPVSAHVVAPVVSARHA